jgi:hypothetical protein
MKKLLLAFGLAAVAGCTSLNDGKSLTEEVTAPPSPAFMKKVAGDPFPAAGTPMKGTAGASGQAGRAPRNGATAAGPSISQQSGTIQFGPSATPTGTAKKAGTSKP